MGILVKQKGSKHLKKTVWRTYSISSSCWRYCGFCSIPIKSSDRTATITHWPIISSYAERHDFWPTTIFKHKEVLTLYNGNR